MPDTAAATGGKRLQTPRCRLSFANLFVPKESDEPGKKPMYGTMLIFDQEAQKTPEFKRMRDELRAAAVARWGDKAAEMAKSGQLHSPFRKGEEKPELKGLAPGFIFINVKSLYKPVIWNPSLTRKLDEGEIASGDYVKVLLTVYDYDYKGKKGVSFGMGDAIQLIAKGEPLGRDPSASASEFEALGDGDDAADDEISF